MKRRLELFIIMFMFKSKQRWSKRRLWCGRHLPDNPIAVFFFGGNCLYNFCQYPIHTKILCKKWRWCVEANLRGLCLCGIGILAIPHQNTSHKRSCYFKNINVVYIQYDTVSEVSKLHLETSLRRIGHKKISGGRNFFFYASLFLLANRVLPPSPDFGQE